MSFELIILGSSSALPTSKRSVTAHLLNINERFFLIDCGEGTQVQLRKFGLSPARINHIFISHLHGDHVFGIFGLLSSLGMMGRKAPIHFYAPKGLSEILDAHFKYFGKPPFPLEITVVKEGGIDLNSSKIELKAVKLNHRVETYGYVFKEKKAPLNVRKECIAKYKLGIEDIKHIKEGKDHMCDDGTLLSNKDLTLPAILPRSYAYISDTRYLPSLARALQNVDLLYHEATFLHKDHTLAEQTLHSTAKEAAQLARDANAGKLLLGHFSSRYKDVSTLQAEARAVFDNSIAVNDGDRFHVKQRREGETI